MTQASVVLRLLGLGLTALVLVPLQLIAVRIDSPVAKRLPIVFHRAFLRIFGVRVTMRGTPPGDTATLVVANHLSWLDIPVIGSLHPLSFIAKAEIENWPGIGLFARLQRSVFIDRERRQATAAVNEAVATRLANGEAIVLFAEGTTGDGNRLLPFRSSLVGAARAALAEPGLERIHLQPLAIAYVRRNGLPVTRRERPAIAWYGDMELAPHLAQFVSGGPLDVAVTWGEPVVFDPQTNRKAATARAEAAVRAALQGLVVGASARGRARDTRPSPGADAVAPAAAPVVSGPPMGEMRPLGAAAPATPGPPSAPIGPWWPRRGNGLKRAPQSSSQQARTP
jgi:1-acyl-sn-glycerol-3-phosphate acyltransferase